MQPKAFKLWRRLKGRGGGLWSADPHFATSSNCFVETLAKQEALRPRRDTNQKARGPLSRASSISESRAGQSSARHPNLARAQSFRAPARKAVLGGAQHDAQISPVPNLARTTSSDDQRSSRRLVTGFLRDLFGLEVFSVPVAVDEVFVGCWK